MKAKELVELAGDPRFISGIYNYCDSWCERCNFTSRCLTYEQFPESSKSDDPAAHDLNNANKIARGFMRNEFGVEDDPIQNDSNGSAKVALIAIDRSIAAWGRLSSLLPEKAGGIMPILSHLEALRRQTEQTFPHARDFIRPGFDEMTEYVM